MYTLRYATCCECFFRLKSRSRFMGWPWNGTGYLTGSARLGNLILALGDDVQIS